MKNKIIVSILSVLFIISKFHSQVNFTITPSICKNDTTFLTANTSTLSNCTYTWASIPANVNFSSPNGSITGVSFMNAGTYTVTLTVMSGTSINSFQNSVMAVALPAITLAQNSLTTCITNNFPLFSVPVSLTATGGNTYTWNPTPAPNMIGNQNAPLNVVRPTVSSCFSVTGTDVNGCKARASLCITVIPRFTITISPSNTVICKNSLGGPDQYAELSSGNPSSPVIGLSTSYSYSWTGCGVGGILTSLFSSSVDVAPSVNCTYTLEIRDSLNCISLPALANVSVLNCTDIKHQNSILQTLGFYPNPFRDKLTISFDTFPDASNITFYNATGQQALQFHLTNKLTELDISPLQIGLYYMRIESGGRSAFHKVIKEP